MIGTGKVERWCEDFNAAHAQRRTQEALGLSLGILFLIWLVVLCVLGWRLWSCPDDRLETFSMWPIMGTLVLVLPIVGALIYAEEIASAYDAWRWRRRFFAQHPSIDPSAVMQVVREVCSGPALYQESLPLVATMIAKALDAQSATGAGPREGFEEQVLTAYKRLSAK